MIPSHTSHQSGQKENPYYLKNTNISLEDLSKIEMIKAFSNFLRGTLKEEIQNDSPYFEESTVQVLKFHGMYQQDDRDKRIRTQSGLQKYHQIMVRCRIPGGILNNQQYLTLDSLATRFGNKTLRITTRQSFQFHGVLKHNIKSVIQEINRIYLTTLGACGDIVRGITGPVLLNFDSIEKKIQEVVEAISEHFMAKTKAYSEIWLDGEPIQKLDTNEEPLYGSQYLPRKFKIGIAKAGWNSNHFFTNDLGIAIDFHGEDIAGYYFYVGGGMGKSHRDSSTFPRVAQYIGWISKEDLIPVAEAVVAVQRDYGNRKDRKHARLKYLIEEKGLNWFREKVEEYSGIRFFIRKEPLWKEVEYLGWHRCSNGKWSLGIHILAGRIEGIVKEILKTIAEKYSVRFQTTAEQNIMISDISDEARIDIEKLFQTYSYQYKPEEKIFHKAIACPALPTCGLAITESERVLPKILGILNQKLKKYGMQDKAPIFRITGCPNGCANPYVAEIALVGRSKGVYALYLGGSREGNRLAKEITDSISIEEFEEFLDKLFFYWSKLAKDQYLGDFVNEMFHFMWIIQPIAQNYKKNR